MNRNTGLLLPALLLALVGTSTRPVQAAEACPDDGLAAWIVAHASQEVDDDRLRLAVLGSGEDASRELFEVLSTGAWADGRRCSAAQEELVLRALALHPPARVEDLLQVACVGQVAERRAGLRLLARTGTGRDLGLAVALAGEGPECEDGALLEALEACILELLRRDPRTVEALRPHVLGAPEAVGRSIVRSAEASALPGSFPALVQLLGYRAGLDPTLLHALAELLPARPASDAEQLASVLLRYVEHRDRSVRREACRAAGRARRPWLAGALIEALEDPERGVRDAARLALVEISGISLPARPERWRSWFAGEERWLAARRDAVVTDLGAIQQERVVAALAEVTAHPLYRLDLAPWVEQALAHEAPTVRRCALSALGQLGATSDPRILVPALEDEDPAVVRAAHQTLRTLTRLDHPPDPRAWSEALTGSVPR